MALAHGTTPMLKGAAESTEILVDGFRAKNGLNRAKGWNITLPDGQVLFVGSSGTGVPYENAVPPEKK